MFAPITPYCSYSSTNNKYQEKGIICTAPDCFCNDSSITASRFLFRNTCSRHSHEKEEQRGSGYQNEAQYSVELGIAPERYCHDLISFPPSRYFSSNKIPYPYGEINISDILNIFVCLPHLPSMNNYYILSN